MESQRIANPEGNMAIMLVDNCDIDNYINQKVLELYGLTNVICFTSSKDALLHLQNSQTKIDLILLEIYLPVIDGFEFIEIFNDLKLGEVHGQIILLSATLNPDHKKLAEEKKIRFMEKPFTVNKLNKY